MYLSSTAENIFE